MRYVSHWPSLTPLLFLAVYLPAGTRPGRGFRKLSAYTRKKALGMTTPATATTVGCSFYSLRGAPSEGIRDRIVLRLANSFTAPTSSTDETATPGQNGGQLERAG